MFDVEVHQYEGHAYDGDDYGDVELDVDPEQGDEDLSDGEPDLERMSLAARQDFEHRLAVEDARQAALRASAFGAAGDPEPELQPAVRLTANLQWALGNFRDRPANYPRYAALERVAQAFATEVGQYRWDVLTAMGRLPDPASIHDWGALARLRTRMAEIAISFADLRALIEILAALESRRSGAPVTGYEMLRAYVADEWPHRHYDAIRSWLYRRSKEGQIAAKNYDKNPANKARRREVRRATNASRGPEWKAAEAARQRDLRVRKRADREAMKHVLDAV